VFHLKPPIIVAELAQSENGLKPFQVISDLMEMNICAANHHKGTLSRISPFAICKITVTYLKLRSARRAPASTKTEVVVETSSTASAAQEELSRSHPSSRFMGHVDHGRRRDGPIRKSRVAAEKPAGSRSNMRL